MSTDLRSDDDAMLVLADLLAPEAASGAQPAGRAPERYVAIPSLARPRYLLPVDAPRAAAADLKAGNGLLASLGSRAVAAPAIRLGALRYAGSRTLEVPAGDPAHPTLAERLAAELGVPQVALSVALGPPRPNRKPVLRITDPAGEPLAYAKVGTSSHAAGLVDHEADFLGSTAAADLRATEVVVPRLFARIEWKGCPIALAEALPATTHLRLQPLPLTASVVQAIAADLAGPPEIVADSRWWKAVRTRADAADEAHQPAIEAAADRVLADLGDTELVFGRWHGDLATWNAQWQGDRLLTWDWERTDGPVPLGFDAIHGSFQFAAFTRGCTVAQTRRCTAAEQAALLADLGIRPALVPALIRAYGLWLALRLLGDARYGGLGFATAFVDDLLADLARPES